MPNTYYVDHGLPTGNNDGSSPDNAWQDFWQVFTGGQSPAYAAGDTIIIRSGNRKATTATSKAQASVGTEQAPVTWVVDDGATVTEWLGDTGVFTIEGTVHQQYIDFKGCNRWIGTNKNLQLLINLTENARIFRVYGGSSDWANNYFYEMQFTEVTPVNAISQPRSIECFYSYTKFERCEFSFSHGALSSVHPFVLANDCGIELVDCVVDIDMLETGNIHYDSIFYPNGRQVSFILRGVSFPSMTAGQSLYRLVDIINERISAFIDARNISIGAGRLVAFDDKGDDFHLFDDVQAYTFRYKNINIQGINNKTDFFFATGCGYAQWEETGNYPVLNAVLPDGSNTGWSIKCFPSAAASVCTPHELMDLHKFWNGSASVLDIRVELAILDTVGGSGDFDNPTHEDWWIEVCYVDSTGVARTENSYASGALTSSDATWDPNPPEYGQNNYGKYKLEVTTSHSVKADSLINCRVFCARPSSADTSFYFVCPDVQLSVSA